MGQVTRETDRAGQHTDFAYNKLGQLLSVTQYPQPNTPLTTRFNYDEAGHKISQTDAKGHNTAWSYDSFGRTLTRTLPEGMTETFSYDANTGNLTSHTDFNGQTSTYNYDSQTDNLLSINYADGYVEQYTYDNAGRRQTAQNPNGTISYRYDAKGQLQTISRPNGISLTYSYDNVGNRTQLQIAAPNLSRTIDYSYDALNRLQSISENGLQTTYSYTPTSRKATVQYPNSTTTSYSYDKFSRLVSLKHHNTATNTLIASYDYTHTPTGHRKTQSEHTGTTTTYSYDGIYRLTQESINDPNTNQTTENSYQHDAASNVIYSIEDGVHTAYEYDQNDRLAKQGGYTYQYDSNGNILTETYENQTISYTWNAAGQLTQVAQQANGTTTSTTSYAYDADGNRIQSSTTDNANNTTNTINYLVDDNQSLSQILAEFGNNNELLATYLHGEDLISQRRNNQTHYYHTDGLGSTRALTDATGNATDSYSYSAYGELTNQKGTTENNYLYTGELYDSALDSYYLRARYYNANSKRFLSMDEFAGMARMPVTLNKYLYGNANPANFTDPTGYFGLMDVGVAHNVPRHLCRCKSMSG